MGIVKRLLEKFCSRDEAPTTSNDLALLKNILTTELVQKQSLEERIFFRLGKFLTGSRVLTWIYRGTGAPRTIRVLFSFFSPAPVTRPPLFRFRSNGSTLHTLKTALTGFPDCYSFRRGWRFEMVDQLASLRAQKNIKLSRSLSSIQTELRP